MTCGLTTSIPVPLVEPSCKKWHVVLGKDYILPYTLVETLYVQIPDWAAIRYIAVTIKYPVYCRLIVNPIIVRNDMWIQQ